MHLVVLWLRIIRLQGEHIVLQLIQKQLILQAHDNMMVQPIYQPQIYHDISEAGILVVPSYCRVPVILTAFGLIAKLCVPPVSV